MSISEAKEILTIDGHEQGNKDGTIVHGAKCQEAASFTNSPNMHSILWLTLNVMMLMT